MMGARATEALSLTIEILPAGQIRLWSPWYDPAAFHASLLETLTTHVHDPEGCACAVEAFHWSPPYLTITAENGRATYRLGPLDDAAIHTGTLVEASYA